jgi:RNA polymerase sigma factor (sigma-70 family)
MGGMSKPGRERDVDVVRMYMNDISRTSMVSAEEEVTLAKRIEAGVYAQYLLDEDAVPDGVERSELVLIAKQGEDARGRFAEANVRLVISIARRYAKPGMQLGDLIQDGNAGLMRAISKFDYRKGYKFSTYATWWIKQVIRRQLPEYKTVVHIPARTAYSITMAGEARDQLFEELGRQPTFDELAERLDMKRETFLYAYYAYYPWMSMSTPSNPDEPDGETLAENLTGGDEFEDRVLSDFGRHAVYLAVNSLPPIEARVIKMYYGMDGHKRTAHADIADAFGLSKSRVQQLVSSAMKKLREDSCMERLAGAI